MTADGLDQAQGPRAAFVALVIGLLVLSMVLLPSAIREGLRQASPCPQRMSSIHYLYEGPYLAALLWIARRRSKRAFLFAMLWASTVSVWTVGSAPLFALLQVIVAATAAVAYVRYESRTASLQGVVFCSILLFVVLTNALPGLHPNDRGRGPSEDKAASMLREIMTAQITYLGLYPDAGFAADLRSLGPPAKGVAEGPNAANLIKENVAGGYRDEYDVVLIPGARDASGRIPTFSAEARPRKDGSMKRCRNLSIDDSGVVRYTYEDRAATVSDPMLGYEEP